MDLLEAIKSRHSVPREAALEVLLAPTAMNQQKFHFELNGNTVKATTGSGFYTKVDPGIAKYHFEAGAGKKGREWDKKNIKEYKGKYEIYLFNFIGIGNSKCYFL